MRISEWSSDVCSSDLAWGIANRVVEPAALRPAALEVASRLARQPRASVTATKALMKRALAVADQMDCEGREFAARLASPEIGRASCRDRVWQYVYISVVAVSYKKKKKTVNRAT